MINKTIRKPKIAENKIEAFKAELKEKYDAYFDSVPSKSKLEEQKKLEKESLKEGFIATPAVHTRHGVHSDAKTSALFSGSVEDIIAKLSKMTEKKSSELYVSKITKEAKQALANLVGKELSAKEPNMKLVSEATSAIESLSQKKSLKEQDGEDKKDDEKKDDEKEMTDEEKAKEKEKEDEKKEESQKVEKEPLSESVTFKYNDILNKVR